MLKFTTSGSAYERGEQQGGICRTIALPWIRRAVDAASKACSRVEIDRFTDKIRRDMEKLSPEGYQECCGIAKGLELNEALYFNATCSWRICGKFLKCTTLGFKTDNMYPVIGKLDDLDNSDLGNNVLEITYPDSGYRHAHFHFAASIWTVAGMNENGLAIAMTGIPGVDKDETGLSSLDALHTILPSCKNVKETLEHLKEIKLNYHGFSLLIGDFEGNLILVEKTGNGMAVVDDLESGFLLHTNHIIDPLLERNNRQPKKSILQNNGLKRYKNACRKIASMERNEDGMLSFLQDRSDEGPILQHGEDGFYTDFGVIMLPKEKEFTYFSGYPDYTERGTVRCNELFQCFKNGSQV